MVKPLIMTIKNKTTSEYGFNLKPIPIVNPHNQSKEQ